MSWASTGGGPQVPMARDPFVGRVEELGVLQHCVREVRDGQPWMVSISGDAGIGKSALVRRVVDDLADFTVLWATCDPSEASLGFGTLGQLAIRLPPDVAEEFPALTPRALDSADPFAAGAELLRLLGRLQDFGPVVLVVVDAQWADESSWQSLGFVMRRLGADQVLVLITQQHSTSALEAAPPVRSWLSPSGAARHYALRLGGLDPTDLVALGQQLQPPVRLGLAAARELRRYTEGNPLYARSLLDELPHDQLVRARFEPPPPVAALIRHQLEELPDESRLLLEGLAVFNTSTPLRTAARAVGVTSPSSALGPLLAKRLVRLSAQSPAARVLIDHRLVRDVVYDSIVPFRRRALHAVVATLVDVESSWSHRVAAVDLFDAALAVDLEEHAQRALKEYKTSTASRYLIWASEVSESAAEQQRRLLSAAALLMWEMRIGAVERLEPDIRRCAPCPRRSFVLGALASERGERDRARQLLREVVAVLGETGDDPTTAAMALVLLAESYSNYDEDDLAVSALNAALGMVPSDSVVHAWAEVALIGIRVRTTDLDAVAEELAAISAAPAEASPVVLNSLVVRASVHFQQGRITSAARDLTSVLRLADTGIMFRSKVEVYANLGWTDYLLGRWTDAAIHADNSIIATEVEGKETYPNGYALAGIIAAARGSWPRAAELLRATWNTVSGHSAIRIFPLLLDAWTCFARGDEEGQLVALQRLEREALEAAKDWMGWSWRPLYVDALLRAGKLSEAESELVHVARIAQVTPFLRLGTAWLGGRLAQARGDLFSARTLLLEGAGMELPGGDVPLARALLDQSLGGVLAELRDRRASASRLARAAHTFKELGATPFLARLGAESARYGLPDSSFAAGPMANLTDRERDIVHLVVRGLTNQEVAAKLFVSPKTVEYHLAHVFDKLGVRSRRRLKEAVGDG